VQERRVGYPGIQLAVLQLVSSPCASLLVLAALLSLCLHTGLLI
jgi:hypothetical protein